MACMTLCTAKNRAAGSVLRAGLHDAVRTTASDAARTPATPRTTIDRRAQRYGFFGMSSTGGVGVGVGVGGRDTGGRRTTGGVTGGSCVMGKGLLWGRAGTGAAGGGAVGGAVAAIVGTSATAAEGAVGGVTAAVVGGG